MIPSCSLSHMSRHTPRRLSKSHARRGQAVRQAMLDYIATCPHPPSLREIGEAVGLSSSSTVWTHVRTLREEGRIAPAKLGQPRAILLADPGPSEVELLRERVAEMERCIAACIHVWNSDSCCDTLDESRWGQKTIRALTECGLRYDEETGFVERLPEARHG